jgi:hypothetical protein
MGLDADRSHDAPVPTSERRAFRRTCAIASAAAGVLFTWMLAMGRLTLLSSQALGGFYDAQAHAWLGGHWDIPPNKLGFEAFIIHDKAYTYLGPWPSILRIPVAAITDRFDGRLTQLSILFAFVVLMIATAQLLWRVRVLLRGTDTPMTRAEHFLVGTFMFLIGAGSIVFFMASRPVPYHEAELWGAAWSIAAFDAILQYLLQPTRAAVIVSGVCTTLALLSRGSVGLAPVTALALVFVVTAIRRRPRALIGLGLAIVVPIALYAYVNYARFGAPFKLPIDKQIATTIDPVRPRIFKGTHGSLFALKYVPTDTWAIFRPSGLAFTRVFPFITFPKRATVVGNLLFASIEPSASLPLTMPLLFVLSLVGVGAAIARRSAALLVLLAGGLIGAIGVVTLPFIDHRYLSDFAPLLVTGAAAGTYAAFNWWEKSTATAARVALAVGAALLALFSVWVNFALALIYQREYSPFTTDGERAAFVRFQHTAPGGGAMAVLHGDSLPAHAPGGTFFVLGDCAGVYWSDGAHWHPIERTQASGQFHFDIRFPDEPPGTSEPLLIAGPIGSSRRIEVEWVARGRVRFVLTAPETVGRTVEVHTGRPTSVDVLWDRVLGATGVSVDGSSVLGLAIPIAEAPTWVAGRDSPKSALDAKLSPSDAPFCHGLRKS